MKSWTMALGLSCLAAINASAQQGGLDLEQALSQARKMTTEARPVLVAAAQRPAASILSRPLQELLGDLEDVDPMIRLVAIQQLAPYVKTNMIVRKRIKSCLADPAVEIRSLSMVTLGETAMEDDSIRLAIQELFLNDDDDAIKLSGMNILWPRIAFDAAVRARILTILQTPIRFTDDLFVVDQAVISVMNAAVIVNDTDIREAVLRILAYDDSWFITRGLISSTAAEALSPLCRDATVRFALQAAAARGVGGAVDALADCKINQARNPGAGG